MAKGQFSGNNNDTAAHPVVKMTQIKYPLLNAVAQPGSLSLVGVIPTTTGPPPPSLDMMKVNFKAMTIEQKKSILRQKAWDPIVTINFRKRSANGEETIVSLPDKVNKKLLLAFSSVAREELKDEQHQVLLLNDGPQQALKILLAYMEDCCKGGKIPRLDVDTLEGCQWMRVWHAAKVMGFDIAIEQLRKHLWRDVHSLRFKPCVDAWAMAKQLKLEEPEKALRVELHDFAWFKYGQIWPSDLEYLHKVAPGADFTLAAFRKVTEFLFNHVPLLWPEKEAKRLSTSAREVLEKEIERREQKINNESAKQQRLKRQAERKATLAARAEQATTRAEKAAKRAYRHVKTTIVPPATPQYTLTVGQAGNQKQRRQQLQKQKQAKLEAPESMKTMTGPTGENATTKASLKPGDKSAARARTGSTTSSGNSEKASSDAGSKHD